MNGSNLLPSFANLIASHDPVRLLLAFGVCFAAALCVFKIRSRMRNAVGVVRSVWIFIAGLEMGVALWASQFLGLLALRTSPMEADAIGALGVLSALVLAAAGAIPALAIAWAGPDRARRLAGGLVLVLITGLLQIARFHITPAFPADAFAPSQVWLAMVACLFLFVAGLAIAGPGRAVSRRVAAALVITVGLFVTHLLMLGALDPTVLAEASTQAIQTGPESQLVVMVMMLSILIICGGLAAAYLDDVQSVTTVMRLRRLADAAREGIVVVKRGRINDANAFFCTLVGEPAHALSGRSLLGDLLRLEGVEGDALPLGEHEGLLHPSDGAEPVPVQVFVGDSAEESAGENLTIVSLRDLRAQRAAEKHIEYLADHDPLTGLPNRRALNLRLEQEIARQHRTRNRIWVVSLNLDRFTLVNDLYGQATGDAMLVEVARRIRDFIGEGDLAARLGGDEFVIARTAEPGQTNVALAEWTHFLMSAIRAPMTLLGRELETGVSAGVSLYPEDGSDADRLILSADIALRRAKERGRNGYCFFEPDMDEKVRDRRALSRDLREALALGQLEVFYQPIARAEDQKICGFEALTRWRHPERGMVPPDLFIPMAEEEGLILELGDWVLRAAALEAATWPQDISISVNLSPMQLTQPDLADKVRQTLFETGLAPRRLVLEVTETALITDQQAALDALRRLKAMGARIAMDDFGTGFSSLSTLHSFPFDKIKIDKQFIDGIGRHDRSSVIVRAVLGIGRGLGVPVVAEGVETAEQLAYLRDEGCDELQGYFIGRPAPASTFDDLLKPAQAPDASARVA